MSDKFDEDATSFFNQEAARDREERESREYIQQQDELIFNMLDMCGAVHIIELNDSNTDTKITAAIAALVESGVDNAEVLVRLRYLEEVTLTSSIAMAMTFEYYGDDASEYKKKLLAELDVSGFDMGWQSAVDNLITGPSLDLNNSDDFILYMETASKKYNRTPHPLARRLTEILTSRDTEGVASEYPFQAELFARLLACHDNVSQRPDSEAFIDEQFRLGLIDTNQMNALKALLPPPV